VASIFTALWRRLAGRSGSTESGEPSAGEATEYKGFRIRPTPFAAKSGFQTSGVIEKDFDEGLKTSSFIRADTHPTRDDAAAFAVAKGKQIIDEQGDRLFDERPARRPPE